jgi:hypothetical protein
MLHSDGSVWLNGTAITNLSAALFSHDVVETLKGIDAKIDAEGSTVTILPETMLQFEGDEIVLDHGSLQLNTARQLKVRVNCLTVIPVSPEWTQFNVTDVNSIVTVAANQKDVRIHAQPNAFKQAMESALSDVIVHQSEKVTRDERCGEAENHSDTKGPLMNSIWAKAVWVGGVVAACVLAICRSDDPISPDKP